MAKVVSSNLVSTDAEELPDAVSFSIRFGRGEVVGDDVALVPAVVVVVVGPGGWKMKL